MKLLKSGVREAGGRQLQFTFVVKLTCSRNKHLVPCVVGSPPIFASHTLLYVVIPSEYSLGVILTCIAGLVEPLRSQNRGSA